MAVKRQRSRRQVWTPEEEAYLVEHYMNGSTVAIAGRLNRTVSKVYRKAEKLGLQKTEAYLHDPKNRCRLFEGSDIGRAFRYPKGHVPANKGLRRPGYSAGRMKETQFKKGERTGIASRNWVPIGTVLPDACGYLRIKVRETVFGKEATGYGNPDAWPQLHRYIWQQHHGPIPPKHLVIFRDRDKTNCAIENLECISMAENARRNAMWNRLPAELTAAILLNGVLKRRLRRLNGQEQDR